MRKYTRDKCPKCGEKTLAPIIYGYPDSELFQLEKEGRAIIGGCIVYEEMPDWGCKNCGAEGKNSDLKKKNHIFI